MDPSKIREKIGRFRILVIGRANAGKTTILQRVCNTRDRPEIYNRAGKKIDPAVLTGSRERGEHDIENEMVFGSQPGFIFHDSRGFEPGGESEFEMVKAFITRRSKETKIANRLHAIWFCIPMDEASRSFSAGEEKFFSECDTGSVPVIVLFTKFDALYGIEFRKLINTGTSRKDAKQLAPNCAEETFALSPQLEFLKNVRWPPRSHICLPNMNRDYADCSALIERTAGALDDDVLKQLFISNQQTNLEICMKYAIQRTLSNHFDSAEKTTSEGYQRIIGTLGAWFPHIRVEYDYFRFLDFRRLRLLDDLFDLLDRDTLSIDHCVVIHSKLLSVTSDSSPLENIVQLISAAVIIFERSFYIFEERRCLLDMRKSDPSFYVALEQYMASPQAAAVRKDVSVAIHTFQGQSSTWKVKPLFGRFQIGKQSASDSPKTELVETIIEIALQHRLPRP